MSKDNSKRKILVVDDDETFRNGLKYLLIQGGYEPSLTVNGKVALELLTKKKFDLVITDINMPECNGLELWRSIKNRYKVPVVLMTAMKSFIAVKESLKLEKISVLTKPFAKEDLFAAIKAHFPDQLSENNEVAQPEPRKRSNFCKLPIDDFVTGKQAMYDIYIELSSEHYVKVAQGGSSIHPEQIHAFKERGVDFLYLTKEDFKSYVKLSMKISQGLQSSKAISRERKVQFLQKTSKILLHSAFVEGINEETLHQSTEVVETTISILTENDALFGLMDLMRGKDGDDPLYRHSLMVSLYSCMIANKLGWSSPNTIFCIAAGALFHDIGKKELPEEFLEKPVSSQTRDERKVYETHALIGAEMLRSVPETPAEVVRIIQQHHENEAGSGYPLHLRKGKIFPLAKLVSVADEFCEAIEREAVIDSVSVKAVLEQMMIFSKHTLDPGMLAALMSVFNIEIPSELKSSISVSVA